MKASRIGAAVAATLSLLCTSAMASRPDNDPMRPDVTLSRHAAPLATKHAAGKSKKTPAIKRTLRRDRSTDLDLPQLG